MVCLGGLIDWDIWIQLSWKTTVFFGEMSVQTYVRVEINFFCFSEGVGGGRGGGGWEDMSFRKREGHSSSDIQDKFLFPNIFDVLVSS